VTPHRSISHSADPLGQRPALPSGLSLADLLVFSLRKSAQSQRRSASGDQLNQQNNERDNQQQVNQTTRDMKAEAEKPQNQNDYKDRPEHNSSLFQEQGRNAFKSQGQECRELAQAPIAN
jgi:hypothetical protein